MPLTTTQFRHLSRLKSDIAAAKARIADLNQCITQNRKVIAKRQEDMRRLLCRATAYEHWQAVDELRALIARHEGRITLYQKAIAGDKAVIAQRLQEHNSIARKA